MKAYELVGYQSSRYTAAGLEGRRELAKLKVVIGAQLRQALVDADLRWSDVGPLLRVRGHGRFDVSRARSFVTPGGQVRWAVRIRSGSPKHRLIIVRLQPGKTVVQDFVFMPKLPRVLLYFTLTDSKAKSLGIVCNSAEEVVRTVWDQERSC
jgi:hypothetical protein